MRWRLLDTTGETTYVLVLDKGDEVVGELTAFARAQHLAAAHFTGIGAFSEVTLGYFERDRRDYRKIPLREQVEVLSLIGDVALDGDEPKLHAHVVVGRADGTAHGGHLMDARVWPTLEVVLAESPRHLHRVRDPETGLALIRL
ncbi:MAG TPA: PPC domain-containing DNA-binding protein [Methylomirabilota bacterium]|nr:PPC domain-containing DNA-binding protein [Methylomirabilota bacterium]